MKIAFEGQLLLDENRTGISWCAHNLIMELAKYPENECTIQCFGLRHRKEYLKGLEEYERAGCSIEICPWFSSVLYKLIWIVFPLPYSLFFRLKPDITQFFNYAVPPGVSGKRVTFIHDMAYADCPETVSRKTKKWLQLCMKRTCRHADKIITVSQFSRKRISEVLQVPKDSIDVVPNAVDHKLYHADYDETRICSVVEKYNVGREYILYLGTIEPRKNIINLIKAYEGLCLQIQNPPQLVLAGGRGWLCDGIYDAVRSAKSGRILCPGYIDQCDVPVLMCGAKIFVFPSVYEGFGMPPLEAMACGTPVITSDAGSLPEIVGDAGVKTGPEDISKMCREMKRLLEDDSYRDKMRELGLKRARDYTWENSAKKLMEIYNKIQ